MSSCLCSIVVIVQINFQISLFSIVASFVIKKTLFLDHFDSVYQVGMIGHLINESSQPIQLLRSHYFLLENLWSLDIEESPEANNLDQINILISINAIYVQDRLALKSTSLIYLSLKVQGHHIQGFWIVIDDSQLPFIFSHFLIEMTFTLYEHYKDLSLRV